MVIYAILYVSDTVNTNLEQINFPLSRLEKAVNKEN